MSWSNEEDKEWKNDLEAFISSHQCPECGSRKVTQSIRGKPYMPFVDWHKAQSESLGYRTLALSGCTKPSFLQCSECSHEFKS